MNKETYNLLKEDITNIKSLALLQNDIDDINKLFEERKAYLTMLNEASVFPQKSFGYIKEAFEDLSSALYENAYGRNILRKYINTIKGNPTLKDIYSIYENIYHAKDSIDVEYILSEAFSKPYSKKAYKKGVESLGNLLTGAFLALEGKQTPAVEENKELNESIDYLLTTKRNMSNLSDIASHRAVVSKYINENAGKNIRETVKVSNLDEMVDNFNEKYSNSEHFGEIKKILENGENAFTEYKSGCLKAIQEVLDNNQLDVNKERLNEVYNAVDKKTFNEETLVTDLINFIQLKDTITNE